MRNERRSTGTQNLPEGLRPGRAVRARGAVWRVQRVSTGTDCLALDLARAEGGGQQQILLHPIDRVQPVVTPNGSRVVTRRRWVAALRSLIDQVGELTLPMTPRKAKVDVLPYQLEPLLAVLGGHASRLLIADAVGLGKTIEAGLIVAELCSRGLAHRVLVITPAGLRQQWMDELQQRFSIAPTLADARWLARRAQELPSTVNPWTLPGCYVTSVDFLKQPEVLAAARDPRWDVLVVDEAHLAASSTDRGSAVHDLAARSSWVVLLTATPHDGNADRFAALCRAGRLEAAEDPLLVFRRGAAVRVGHHHDRVRVLKTSPTPAEMRAQVLLDRYARQVWTSTGRAIDAGGARLAMTVLMKRAYSSMRALERSARRRLHLLETAAPSPAQASLPLGASDRDGELGSDEEPDSVLGAHGLENPAHERAWLGAIAEAARTASREERKIALVRRLLTRTSESLLLFTEFRDTAAWIARSIVHVASFEVLHGGLTERERHDAISGFVSGRARVLLATDAAALGLNLQQHCRLVVNLEVPWNPNRIAQRIGRVARIGQRRRVHAVILVGRGTGEERVLELFSLRQRRIHASLGQPQGEPVTDDVATGTRILEDTAATTLPHGVRAPVGRPVTLIADASVQDAGSAFAAQAIRCARIILRQRAVPASRGDRGRAAPGRPLVASVRLRGNAGWIVGEYPYACLALVRASLVDGRAHPWATTLVALTFQLEGEARVVGARGESLRQAVDRSRQELEAEAQRRLEQWTAEIRCPIECFVRRATNRARALDRRMAADRRRSPQQLGLFATGARRTTTADTLDAGSSPAWLAGTEVLTLECDLALAARFRIHPPSTMPDRGPGPAEASSEPWVL